MTLLPGELLIGSALKDQTQAAGLVLMRDVELNATEFLGIVELLGTPASPWDATGVAAADERVQDMRVKGGQDGMRTTSSQLWHSDQSFAAAPPEFTGLYCRQAARRGAGTEFCDMRLRALPPALGAAAVSSEVWVRHSFRESLGVLLGGRRPTEHMATLAARFPDVRHPLVRQQPDTGELAVLLSPLTARDVPEIFGALLKAAVINVYQHVWRAGDLLIWDNSAVMHRREVGPVDGDRAHWRLVTQGRPVYPGYA